MKVVNFDVWKSPNINWLPQQRPLSDRKTNASFILLAYKSTNGESWIKIGLVVAEIFGDICQFLQSRPRGAFVTLVISGVTGPILIWIAQNVATILTLNIFESELPYSYPFQNASLPNEGHFDFNWLPWQRLLKNQKRGPDRSSSNKYLSFGEKIAKIGPVDPEIICLHLKKIETRSISKCWAHSPLRPVLHCHSTDSTFDNNNDNDNAWQRGPLWPHRMGPINASKIYSQVGKLAERAKIYSSFGIFAEGLK